LSKVSERSHRSTYPLAQLASALAGHAFVYYRFLAKWISFHTPSHQVCVACLAYLTVFIY